MLIDSNFYENIEKMKRYFTAKLDFIDIADGDIYTDSTIEYELHLVNRQNNTHIDIIKFLNDDDIEVTLNGNSNSINEYSLCMDYFLNKQKLVEYNMHDFIDKIDKEIENLND